MKTLNKTTLAALLATLLLSACGSGDDEGYNTDFTPPTIGDGDNDDTNPDPEYDYSRNGVFLPIVKDDTKHFDYKNNSRLVIKDYELEYFGITEPMVYIENFEWNDKELTMPLAVFFAEIGLDNRKEILSEFFNDCELDRYTSDPDGFYVDDMYESEFVARCGGFDKDGKHITYNIAISGYGEIREYENTWLKEGETVMVRAYDNFEVALSLWTEFVDDPTQPRNYECRFTARHMVYTEEMYNENPEKYKIFDTGGSQKFYCGNDYLL